jgi:hypothetical protein
METDQLQTSKNAIALAEASGVEKFDLMFRRDASETCWRVSFKTMRRSRVGDSRLPYGFPSLGAFFEHSRSLRVFKWGFEQYDSLYGDSSEHRQNLRAVISQLCDRVQRRCVCELTNKPFVITAVQHEIVDWVLRRGVFDQTQDMPPKLRALRNWRRVRAHLHMLAFLRYVCAKARASRAARAAAKAHRRTNRSTSPRSPCASPSLKKVCV